MSACRVAETDLTRWETTQRGPEKLKAVLIHEKYEMPLRSEAALSLIRMKPRGGRMVGIDILVDSLALIPAGDRDKILASIIPTVMVELRKDPPAAQAGQPLPPDPSFPFKDAAYAILTFDKPILLTDDKLREDLRHALTDWAMKDFDHRLENRNQKYGMEQLLRLLGPEGVRGLPEKVNRDARTLDKMARLLDELASPETRQAASAEYVKIAKWILSEEWVNARKPLLEASNTAAKYTPTPEQFAQQLEQYQDEDFTRALGNLKVIGGRPAIDFGLDFAANTKAKKERRAFALAALELKLDPKNPDDVKRIFAIATSELVPEVTDQAFRRIGEMPREVVVGKLYDVFKSEQWKVRRAAAGIVIKMSETKHLDEFMSKLPEKEAKGFSRGEALTYGAALVDLKNGDVKQAITKYLSEPVNMAPRATAFSFFLMNGLPADLDMLTRFEEDRANLPVCESDDECKWNCYVPDEKKPDERVLKDVKTFGEYVKFCVKPSIVDRAAQAKKDAAKDGEKK